MGSWFFLHILKLIQLFSEFSNLSKPFPVPILSLKISAFPSPFHVICKFNKHTVYSIIPSLNKNAGKIRYRFRMNLYIILLGTFSIRTGNLYNYSLNIVLQRFGFVLYHASLSPSSLFFVLLVHKNAVQNNAKSLSKVKMCNSYSSSPALTLLNHHTGCYSAPCFSSWCLEQIYFFPGCFFFFLKVEGKVAELLLISFLASPLLFNTDPVLMLFQLLVAHQIPAILLESNC